MSEAALKVSDFPYPGIPGTADGTVMVVHVETRATDCAAAYPITSSTQMGMGYQAAHADGFKNVFGRPISWMELESEHSSMSACEGYALAGGRVTNFTSGQGLVLMKEVLFTCAGKRLPIVLNVGARALTSQSLNVHAGHDDVMAVADAGWGILFAKNVQETGDLCLIARRAAEASLTPFMNVQDGFLTTHAIENCLFPEDDLIRTYLGDSREKLRRLFDPEAPLMFGTVQNQDSYMSGKIAQRFFYDKVPGLLRESMEEFYRLTGRRYNFIETVGMKDADYAIVSLGSTSETAMAALEPIREMGFKVGVVNIVSFRPFPGPEVARALSGVKAFSVIERCDVPLAEANPLTTDILAALAHAASGEPGYPRLDRLPACYSGTGGLGSRDVTPGHLMAVARNMAGDNGKRYFCLGIDHPASLPADEEPDVRPPGSFSIRGHSVGGYGSVTTNKVIATMLGDIFGFAVQAAPKYGSEKKGLPTNMYLSITKEGKILTHCELQHVDFVPLMDPSTWNMGNPCVGLAKGGILFQHTPVEEPEALWNSLPAWAKYRILDQDLRLFAVDTVRIARECCKSDDSLLQRFQGIVLLGVFLRITPFREAAGMSVNELFERVEGPLRKYFGKRGDKVVEDNVHAVRKGFEEVFEVPRSVMEATPAEELDQGKLEWEQKGTDVNAFFV